MKNYVCSLLLIVLASSCGGGTVAGSPIRPKASLTVELGPNQNAQVSQLSLCVTQLRFFSANGVDAADVAVASTGVTIGAVPSALATVSIPQGSYARVEADLSASCASGTSLKLSNSNGTYSSTDTLPMGFSGTFATESTAKLTLLIQPIVDSLDTVTSDSQISSAVTAVGGTVQAAPPPAFVQGAVQEKSTAVSSVSKAFASANSSGDLIIVGCHTYSTTGETVTVSDTAGNTYNQVLSWSPSAGIGTDAVFYAKNILAAAAGNSVTCQFSASDPFGAGLTIGEYSGLDTSDPFDQSAKATGFGISASATLTPSNPSELVLFLLDFGPAESVVPNSSLTLRVSGDMYLSDLLFDGAGSVTGGYTLGGQANWAVMAVSFH